MIFNGHFVNITELAFTEYDRKQYKAAFYYFNGDAFFVVCTKEEYDKFIKAASEKISYE